MGKFHLVGALSRQAPEPDRQHEPSAPLASAVHHAKGLMAHASTTGKLGRYAEDSDDPDKHSLISSVVASPSRMQAAAPMPASEPSGQQQQYGSRPPTAPPQPESSQQQYSRLASRMVGCVNELRAHGADVALELPTIVVCGQQSAGKSSVVEGICGVPLPRNQETCTRCPTELRLSQQPPASGAQWEAVVKLRREPGSSSGSGAAAGAGAAAAAAAAWSPATHPQQQQQQQQQGREYSPMSNSIASASACSTPGRQHCATAALHDAAAPAGGLESVFQAGITNPAALPAVVQAAQAALLTPHASRLSGSGDSRRTSGNSGSFGRGAGVAAVAEAAIASGGKADGAGSAASGAALLKFTRDVVVVEVRGAPADLTLIDLPGIVANVERPEDEHYKALVSELVSGYMARPGTVIIVTITCKEDIDTQGVLSMAREADPRGERTLGVLTKADQVEEGCHGQWLAVLAGERYPLALGWYAVRNPNQAALLRGTTAASARQQEDAFFAGTAPWNRLPPASRARVGTLRLREAMSKQLVAMVAAARPALMAAAQQQLAALRLELAALPPVAVLGDSHAEMLRLIDDVSSAIRDEVMARSQSKQFYQHLLSNFQQLKQQLEGSRPIFLLPRGSGGGCLAVTCALDGDLAAADDARPGGYGSSSSSGQAGQRGVEHSNSSSGTPTARSGPGLFELLSSNSSGSKAGGGMQAAGSSSSSTLADRSQAVLLAACPHQVLLPPEAPEARRGWALDDVRQLVERHHSVELPGFSPYSAVQDLVGRHQRGWGAAVAECAGAAHRQLLQLVLLHIGRTFGRFPRAAEHIRELAAEMLEELLADTSSAVEGLVAMELAGAFAVARREFSRASSQHLEGLKTLMAAGASLDSGGSDAAARREHLPPLPGAATAAGPHASGLYEPAPGAVLSAIPATATGPCELLSMMAVALTYYGISCRRLCDTVSLSVMHHLVNAFSSKFRSRLAAQLLSLPAASVAAMLVEDAASAARRAALAAQRDMLEQALKVIRAAA